MKQHNFKIIIVFFFSLSLNMIMFNTKLNAQGTGFVKLEGNQFKDSVGQNLYPLICNYTVALPYIEDLTDSLNPIKNKFVIAPDNAYGHGSEPELYNGSASIDVAHDRLLSDFNQIKNMGFNTIRLMAILNKNKISGDANYFYTKQLKYNTVWTSDPPRTFQFSPDSLNTKQYDNLRKLLLQYDEVIDLAKDAGLYILLVPAGNVDLFKNQTEVDDYKNLLIAFGKTLFTKSNILGYDLFNEPNFTEGSDEFPYLHQKADICTWTNEIYEALKATDVDPNHLITLGGHIIFDVLEWDPSVLKIDFWAPHFYPHYFTDRPVDFNDIQSTTHNAMIWMKNNCPMPWVIGETGFVAEDADFNSNFSKSLVWGTEAQQSDYADSTLNIVRNTGGSGFGWWGFQHYHWYGKPDTTKIGTPQYLTDLGNYYKNNFGLLRSGDPINCDTTTHICDYSVLEKPVVSIFRDYLDSITHQPPNTLENTQPNADYFNPDHHPTNTVTTGTVLDMANNPIKDAVVFGWSEWEIINDDLSISSFSDPHYTFTDSAGNFTLIPYSPVTPSSKIIALRISAIGYERYYAGWPPIGYTDGTLINNNTYHLNGIKNKLFNNLIVNNGDIENYFATKTLTVSNLTIASGGISDIEAPNEITLLSGFSAEYGSDVYLHNDTPFVDCSLYTNFDYLLPSPSMMSVNKKKGSSNDIDKEIILTFIKEKSTLRLQLQPNPSKGTTLVSLVGQTDETIKQIIVINMLGTIVAQGMCDNTNTTLILKQLPKGIYFIKAIETTRIIDTKKLIIN